MGTVSLHREGEVEIAKKIEEGEKQVIGEAHAACAALYPRSRDKPRVTIASATSSRMRTRTRLRKRNCTRSGC
jgi:hypothetical protein